MNMKKIKKFFTLARRHDGFTLVELIVVIAILAILGGVAVPAYNGYVKKTNKGMDEILVSEVKHALELGYYAGNIDGSVYVLLGMKAEDLNYGENIAVEKSLRAVFGDSFDSQLVLKYDGWNATFQGSNFYGDMDGLVNKVDTLTSALAQALEVIEGGTNFKKYVEGMGAETNDAKANAAVFYVADGISAMSSEKLTQACTDMKNGILDAIYTGNTSLQSTMYNMSDSTNSNLTSAALMYAMATGFAEYYKTETNGDETLINMLEDCTTSLGEKQYSDGVNAAVETFDTLGGNFVEMIKYVQQVDPEIGDKYISEYMANDAAALADAMRTISSGKDSLLNNSDFDLSTPEAFGNSNVVNQLLGAYSNGGIFVFLQETEAGFVISSSIDE